MDYGKEKGDISKEYEDGQPRSETVYFHYHRLYDVARDLSEKNNSKPTRSKQRH